MPRQKRESSTVIALRLPPNEYYCWQTYCKIKNISISVFIQDTMEAYLDLQILKSCYDEQIVKTIKGQLESMPIDSNAPLHHIAFRVRNLLLNQWDDYCTRLYVFRTALIRQAVNFFMNLNPEDFPASHVIEQKRNIILLYNMIKTIGPIVFKQIVAIFSEFKEQQIMQMLNTLEQEGMIGRKGFDMYMTMEAIEDSTIVMDPRAMAELFEHFTKNLQDSQFQPTDSGHISLLGRIFEYISEIIKVLYISNKDENDKENEEQPNNVSQSISLANISKINLQKSLGALLNVSFQE